jgi:hypothetical protein
MEWKTLCNNILWNCFFFFVKTNFLLYLHFSLGPTLIVCASLAQWTASWSGSIIINKNSHTYFEIFTSPYPVFCTMYTLYCIHWQDFANTILSILQNNIEADVFSLLRWFLLWTDKKRFKGAQEKSLAYFGGGKLRRGMRIGYWWERDH